MGDKINLKSSKKKNQLEIKLGHFYKYVYHIIYNPYNQENQVALLLFENGFARDCS